MSSAQIAKAFNVYLLFICQQMMTNIFSWFRKDYKVICVLKFPRISGSRLLRKSFKIYDEMKWIKGRALSHPYVHSKTITKIFFNRFFTTQIVIYCMKKLDNHFIFAHTTPLKHLRSLNSYFLQLSYNKYSIRCTLNCHKLKLYIRNLYRIYYFLSNSRRSVLIPS